MGWLVSVVFLLIIVVLLLVIRELRANRRIQEDLLRLRRMEGTDG
jgi:hypothetical protein